SMWRCVGFWRRSLLFCLSLCVLNGFCLSITFSLFVFLPLLFLHSLYVLTVLDFSLLFIGHLLFDFSSLSVSFLLLSLLLLEFFCLSHRLLGFIDLSISLFKLLLYFALLILVLELSVDW